MRLASLTWLVLATLQLPPTAPPRDAPSSRSASSALSGRISERDSGRPLPRALVTLRPLGSSPRASVEAEADAQGHYQFRDVQPGEYTLSAGPGEHRATHLRQAFGEAAPTDPGAAPTGGAITLKPGEVRSDVHIALARALGIDGRISDLRGEAMAGIEVRLMRADGAQYPTRPAYSDDRGEFRLFGIVPGRYRVCVIPWSNFVDSLDASRFVRTCHPDSIDETNAADVVLVESDAAAVDIQMQRSGTYSVSGSITDAAGSPAGGAFVGAYRDDGAGATHTTGSDGRFTLMGLITGRYLLTASIGGPANPSDPRPPAREREVAYASIDVDSADVSGLNISLSKGQRVAGRVSFEGESTPNPRQLKMIVQARESRDLWARLGERPPYAPVNDNLEFELTGIYGRPLVIGINGLPDGWVLKSVRYDGRDITDIPTDFAASSSRPRLQIVLTNRTAWPSVRVTDHEGNPVLSYYVVLIPTDPARWKGPVWGVAGTPSRDGSFSLGPRLPGDYLLAALTAADHSVLTRDSWRIESLAAVSSRVTLVEGDQRMFELRLTRIPSARR